MDEFINNETHSIVQAKRASVEQTLATVWIVQTAEHHVEVDEPKTECIN